MHECPPLQNALSLGITRCDTTEPITKYKATEVLSAYFYFKTLRSFPRICSLLFRCFCVLCVQTRQVHQVSLIQAAFLFIPPYILLYTTLVEIYIERRKFPFSIKDLERTYYQCSPQAHPYLTTAAKGDALSRSYELYRSPCRLQTLKLHRIA